jgi:archaellum component FlaF (FlaF/FlaG flagellin family)
MKSSRIVTFTAAIALSAMLVGAAVFYKANTNESVQTPEPVVPAEAVSLDPVVVVATR